jgi:hypothetical protein
VTHPVLNALGLGCLLRATAAVVFLACGAAIVLLMKKSDNLGRDGTSVLT